MKAEDSILTKEERQVLVLAGAHPNGQHLSNTEIADHLGMSVSKVKILIHQACIKLEAHNRIEAMFFALTRGEIRIDEIYSHSELAEMMGALCTDARTRLMGIVRKKLDSKQFTEFVKETTSTEKREKTVLTRREQDVLALVGRGLTNREIADTLYMSASTVRAFLHRACTKLEARGRLDALVLALKRGEVAISETLSYDELRRLLNPLGSEALDKIDKLLTQKKGQYPVPISSASGNKYPGMLPEEVHRN